VRTPAVLLAALLSGAHAGIPPARSVRGGVEAGVQATGRVAGVVTAAPMTRAPIRVTIDATVCGGELPDEAVIAGPKGGLANAVVVLAGLRAGRSAADITIANAKCRFVPRVQVARPGVAVHAVSRDPMLHTTDVRRPDGSTLFNLALPMPGITLTRPLARAGVYRVVCSIHPWMRGWVIVTDDMAAVTAPDGAFTLAGVPPGTYELTAWHEALTAPPQTVTVTSGKTTSVAFAMK
jgi:plastocyanin